MTFETETGAAPLSRRENLCMWLHFFLLFFCGCMGKLQAVCFFFLRSWLSRHLLPFHARTQRTLLATQTKAATSHLLAPSTNYVAASFQASGLAPVVAGEKEVQRSAACLFRHFRRTGMPRGERGPWFCRMTCPPKHQTQTLAQRTAYFVQEPPRPVVRCLQLSRGVVVYLQYSAACL